LEKLLNKYGKTLSQQRSPNSFFTDPFGNQVNTGKQ
jgi:hypothetical protein